MTHVHFSLPGSFLRASFQSSLWRTPTGWWRSAMVGLRCVSVGGIWGRQWWTLEDRESHVKKKKHKDSPRCRRRWSSCLHLSDWSLNTTWFTVTTLTWWTVAHHGSYQQTLTGSWPHWRRSWQAGSCLRYWEEHNAQLFYLHHWNKHKIYTFITTSVPNVWRVKLPIFSPEDGEIKQIIPKVNNIFICVVVDNESVLTCTLRSVEGFSHHGQP